MVGFILSCATVKINAPIGKEVTLLSETDSATFKTTKKVWYLLWGLVPVTDNSTETTIAQYNLKNVRVTTQYDVIDYVVSFFLGWLTIHSKTVIIEGNASAK